MLPAHRKLLGTDSPPSELVIETLFLLDSLSSRLSELSSELEYLSQNEALHFSSHLSHCTAGLQQIKTELLGQQHSFHSLVALRSRLRMTVRVAAASLIAADWQAPATKSALARRTGRGSDRLDENRNDYKREAHLDLERFEHQFSKQFVSQTHDRTATCLAFSSGMAALHTVISFCHRLFSGYEQIVWQGDIYHESRFLLEQLSKNQVLADFWESGAAPKVLVVDLLTNREEQKFIDLERILENLNSAEDLKTGAIVVDSTMVGPFFSAEEFFQHLPEGIRLFVVESLAKLHQYGLDLVTGGVVRLYSTELRDHQEFKRFRTHCGTVMSDFQAAALPEPNRALLERRVRRMAQNATTLASRLKKLEQSEKLFEVHYAGLNPKEVSFIRERFGGTCLVLKSRAEGSSRNLYVQMRNAVLSRAAAYGVDISCSTSFGFDTTRLYLIDSQIEGHIPFFRIACGVEPPEEFEKVCRVFEEVQEEVSWH